MNSAIIAAVLLIAFVIIASVLFLRFIKYLATRETSTEDLISDCFDSYFQLQKRLSENPRYKPASERLGKALDIFLDVEQMIAEEDNG